MLGFLESLKLINPGLKTQESTLGQQISLSDFQSWEDLRGCQDLCLLFKIGFVVEKPEGEPGIWSLSAGLSFPDKGRAL